MIVIKNMVHGPCGDWRKDDTGNLKNLQTIFRKKKQWMKMDSQLIVAGT